MDVASRLTATESIDEQCALNMMMLVSPPSSPRVSSLPFSGCRTERQEHRQCWARQEGRRRRRGGWWSATAPSPPSSWLGHHLNGPLSFRLGLIGLGSTGRCRGSMDSFVRETHIEKIRILCLNPSPRFPKQNNMSSARSTCYDWGNKSSQGRNHAP